jgi:hypothetical protein
VPAAAATNVGKATSGFGGIGTSAVGFYSGFGPGQPDWGFYKGFTTPK